jgi:hypothetical protein
MVTFASMRARSSCGYVAALVTLVASCGESENGSPAGSTPAGGATSSSGSPSISGSSGSPALQGGTGGSSEPRTGGRAAATGGDANNAGAGAVSETGGTSSGPSDAGSTGEAGGEGGAGTAPQADPLAQYRACTEYFRVQCERRDACHDGLSLTECSSLTLRRCPDLLFAPGSRLSLAEVDDCAQAWEDASCDDINRGLFPDCGYTQGAIETGEPCAFSAQCATLACGNFGDDECGVCLPVLKEGDACSGSQGTCPRGTECAGTCRPTKRSNLPAGSACTAVAQCEAGYVCRSDADGVRTCQLLFEIGETCAASWECREGYCDADTGQCTVGAAVGMPCAEDGWGHLRSCAQSAICEDRTEPALCTARVGATEICWLRSGVVDYRGNCSGELQCLCSDADCSERRCRFERRAGEACDDAQSACMAGTDCRAGVCEPTGAQGIFEDVCRP